MTRTNRDTHEHCNAVAIAMHAGNLSI